MSKIDIDRCPHCGGSGQDNNAWGRNIGGPCWPCKGTGSNSEANRLRPSPPPALRAEYRKAYEEREARERAASRQSA